MRVIVQHKWNRFRFPREFPSVTSNESRDDWQETGDDKWPTDVADESGSEESPWPPPPSNLETSWKKKKSFRSNLSPSYFRTFRSCIGDQPPYEPRRALVAFSYTVRRPVVAKEIRNKGERTSCGRPRWSRGRGRERERKLWRALFRESSFLPRRAKNVEPDTN